MEGNVGSAGTGGDVVGKQITLLIGEAEITVVALGFGGRTDIDRGGDINIGFGGSMGGNIYCLAVHPGIVPPFGQDSGGFLADTGQENNGDKQKDDNQK